MRITTVIGLSFHSYEEAKKTLGNPEQLFSNWNRRNMLPWLYGDVEWPKKYDFRELDARGWPMLSLQCTPSRMYKDRIARHSDGIVFNREQGIYRLRDTSYVTTLPLQPIWLGFLFNTLFNSCIWLGLYFGLRTHLRIVRRWQGHCPMCKYDLRGELEQGCPECGWNRDSALNKT